MIKCLLFLYLFLPTNRPTQTDTVVAALAKQTTQVSIANINCKICCGPHVIVGDTIIINQDGTTVKTLELPFQQLTQKDITHLFWTLKHLTLEHIVRINGHYVQTGDLNLVSPMTEAFIFRNKDATIIGQLMVNVQTKRYNLYYFNDGKFTKVRGKQHETDIGFFNVAQDAFMAMGRHYKLDCISFSPSFFGR